MVLAVNAFVEGSNLIYVRREPDGRLKRESTRAEWSVFLQREAVTDERRRYLTKHPDVVGLKVDPSSPWAKLSFRGGVGRRNATGGRGWLAEELQIAKTYEGDVDPVVRWASDNRVEIQRPRRIYIDIETDSRVPFSRKEDARILSWVARDDSHEVARGLLAEDSRPAERDLVEALWKALQPYDQVLAWNGDRFDYPVIWARTDACGVRNVDERRWLWLDQLALYKRMNTAAESGDEKQSMALQRVAMGLLGEGKDDFDSSKTWEAWVAGGAERQRLLDYNAKDVELLPKIEAHTGFATLFDTLAEVTGVFPHTLGLEPTQFVDSFMLRLASGSGTRFPTLDRNREKDKYGGAYVMQPRENGILRNVHVADFASLYPSIILAWNMSPETWKLVSPNGPIPEGMCRTPTTYQGFTTGEDGMLPRALRQVLELRKEWKNRKNAEPPGTDSWKDADRRSTAYKVAANSFYGVIGSVYSRYYDRRVAESVSLSGKWLIEKTIEAAEERGIRVVYGDTDSTFCTGISRTAFAEFVKWCNEDLYPKLLAKQGCKENPIKLAYEKEFERLVFVAAKKYAGSYAHADGKEATASSKPEIKGLEYKRGDASKLARALQEKVVMMILRGEESVEAYRAVIDEARSHVLEDELPVEEVTLSKGLSKPIKEYEKPGTKKDGSAFADLAHVAVAKELAKRGLEVGEGTRIEYVVLDSTTTPTKVIPSSDYTGEVDRHYTWETLVWPATQRLLLAAFPSQDWTSYDRTRPPKPRGKAARVPEEQRSLEQAAPLSVWVDSELDELALRMVAKEQGDRAVVVVGETTSRVRLNDNDEQALRDMRDALSAYASDLRTR